MPGIRAKCVGRSPAGSISDHVDSHDGLARGALVSTEVLADERAVAEAIVSCGYLWMMEAVACVGGMMWAVDA